MNILPIEAADYLLHLLRQVENKTLSVREALQRAHKHGCLQGRIEGLENAKDIIGAPK